MNLVGAVKDKLRPGYSRLLGTSVAKRLRTSDFAFERYRQKYFALHPLFNETKSNATKDTAFDELLENGIVVLPGYFASEPIKVIHDACFDAAERLRRGVADPAWSTLVYSDDGIYRIRQIDSVVPQAGMIVDDTYLNDLATRYLGLPIRVQNNYLDYKPDFGKHDDTTVPHMDSWMSQIKIFVLLTDVTSLTAPLVYWKRSHLDWAWRRDFDYQHFRETEHGSAGICPPSVLRARCEHDAVLEKVTVTGPAGTVVIADTRGFHRASNVFEGYRLEIVQKFAVQMP